MPPVPPRYAQFRRARAPAVANGRLPNEVVELPIHSTDAPGFAAVSFALAAALDRALAARIHRFQDRPFQAYPQVGRYRTLDSVISFLDFVTLIFCWYPNFVGPQKRYPCRAPQPVRGLR